MHHAGASLNTGEAHWLFHLAILATIDGKLSFYFFNFHFFVGNSDKVGCLGLQCQVSWRELAGHAIPEQLHVVWLLKSLNVHFCSISSSRKKSQLNQLEGNRLHAMSCDCSKRISIIKQHIIGLRAMSLYLCNDNKNLSTWKFRYWRIMLLLS